MGPQCDFENRMFSLHNYVILKKNGFSFLDVRKEDNRERKSRAEYGLPILKLVIIALFPLKN